MTRALRPGGWLLVESADPRLQPLACPDGAGPAQELANRLRNACWTLQGRRTDLGYGRTLPRRLRCVGLTEIGAEASFPLAGPASARLQRTMVERVRDRLTVTGMATTEEIDQHLADIDAGRLDLTAFPVVSAWGRKGAGNPRRGAMAEAQAAAGRGGLRERKKVRTRVLIREHALRLFAEQGFEATTVEQIAAAADVSPSTFFRYFPSKDDVVTGDGPDALVIESLRGQPPRLGPAAAVRAAVGAVLAALPAGELTRLSSSARLGMSAPQAREFARTTTALAGALAQRDGRGYEGFTDRVLAGAMIGAIAAAALPGPGKPATGLPAWSDASLARLESGPAAVN